MVDTILGRDNPLTAFLRGEAGYTGDGETPGDLPAAVPPAARPAVTVDGAVSRWPTAR